MNKDLVAIFEYMERERGIKRELVAQAIEEALLIAARKRLHDQANVRVNVNAKTGDFEVLCEKMIVEEVENPGVEIALDVAREIDPDCALGEFIDIEITPEGFGRIAAQAAKQVIAQKLRSAERDVIYEEYRHRIGEIVSGTVKRFVRGANLMVDLGKVEAIMPAKEYPKTERYQVGDRVHGLLLTVQDLENGGAEVVLSRSHPDFVRALFEQEVPEISDGTVVIEKIVREAGYRAKICVRSNDSRVDPVGTCVGVRGARVKAVVRELENEKVDIIPYADDPVLLLQNALDPVEIRKISVNEADKVISIVVDDEAYATVIGRKGLNARLNGLLIGYDLEAQKMSEYQRLMTVTRAELAESSNPALDQKLKIPGITSLVVDNLIDAGYDTARKVLRAGTEDLASVPGISLEMAERVLEGVQTAYTPADTLGHSDREER
ncbi:MAG: transcription termination/antitermination protein NusA [Verrucomicrobia bacterium]|nr:transcription termination/antitermination protein NusA [Verrucomicrobiota bacterium]